MCGICGALALTDESVVDVELLRAMNRTLIHRGPDDEGYYQDGPVGLAIRRLSIIDLDTGHQPLSNEDGTLWIVFNGEIYNYRELRKDLERRGHRFVTHSDTEVIVHAYEEFGVTCLGRLNGMFAFAIWDSHRRSLWLVRDRIGIKPLYYYRSGRIFLFASEIKAILAHPGVRREIDPTGLNNYFTFGHSVAPDTLYKGIKKLLPGHWLRVEDEKFHVQSYWEVMPTTEKSPVSNEQEVAERLLELLKSAVNYQLVSDVPLGALLSGGLDSSSVVGLMSGLMNRPVDTFNVTYSSKGAYDESPDAKRVARHFGTTHHELVISPDDLVDVVRRLAYHYDEPFADAACIPTYLVSRFARQKVKVVLTGDGGDELFGGYRRHILEQWAWLTGLPFALFHYPAYIGAKLFPELWPAKRLTQAMGRRDPVKRWVAWRRVLSEAEKNALLTPEARQCVAKQDPHEAYRSYWSCPGDPVNRLLYVDMKTWLSDAYLEKVDKASMAASLEARVPLLDHRLVEFALGLKSSLKVCGRSTKYILKKAVASLLPEEILNKKKHGFNVPTDPWLRGPLKEFVLDLFLSDRSGSHGYIDRQAIVRLVERHANGREVLDEHLWILINFELWYQTFMGPSSAI